MSLLQKSFFRDGKERIRFKRTKIVATIAGKACTSDFIRDLWQRGMDVVRLNTAHITVEELSVAVAAVRSVSPAIAILVDTKGPNIRTSGIPAEGISLKKGELVSISGKEGAASICVNYPSFVREVPIGSRIICDDGAAGFKVVQKEEENLILETAFDCVVYNRKSINVPNVHLNAPALTEKDKLFLSAAIECDIDFIAHSFVRGAEDIAAVREYLGERGKNIRIIAKIENREGVDNLEEILDAADGIMVARGDLGIEIPLEEVPAIQKRLIHAAMEHAKPVITATQMLQSMENALSPTRAEVSDVANAVYDGTDAVMLSGETAHGKHPCEAVETMARIVLQAENDSPQFITSLKRIPESSLSTAYILDAAVNATKKLPVKAIVCGTSSGRSALVCSAVRPSVPLLATTPDAKVARQLSLSYGVFPARTEFTANPEEQAMQTLEILRSLALDFMDTDMIVIISKNDAEIARNNLICLISVGELKTCFQGQNKETD